MMDSSIFLKLLLLGTLVVLLYSEEDNGFLNVTKKQNSICDLPLALGDCQFNITRFYYDKNTNQCYKFLYSGCKGNGNRFISDKQCRQRCHQERKKNYNAILNDLIEPYQSRFNLTCENCHTINGICVDNKCQCRMGYQLIDYKCVDVNECIFTTCGKNAVCVNSLGSFRCECSFGYGGSGLNCSRSQDICGQKFDQRYEENCNNTDPPWQLRYYYNYTANQCQQFRYGGCQFEGAQNIFRDLQACQTHCHGFHYLYETKNIEKPIYDYSYTTESTIPDLCFDTFDQSKRFPCTEGIWKKRYFFDKSSMKCTMFWYDESCDRRPRTTTSRNIFVHERTCVEVCELTAGRMLESRKHGISGVIHAIFDHDWDGAKAIRDRLLTTPSPRLSPTSTIPSTTTSIPSTSTSTSMMPYHTTKLFENVITPLPLPDTPTPFTVEVKLEEVESMLVGQNVTGEDKRNEILIIKSLNETFDEKTNYSLAVHLPVTIAGNCFNSCQTKYKNGKFLEECLEKFDQNLAHSCQQTPDWKTRYFFDSTTRTCKAYWFGGCWSHSRNNFESLETCKWKCIGEHYEPISHSCLDKFDKKYLEDCQNGVYEIRYFFNHNTKRCESLYFGGCQSQSRNFFVDRHQCQQYCESVPKDLSNFCLQPFDPVYRNSCSSDGSWSQYYYYDSAADSCKMFWYGNCKSGSQNIFATLESCEWLCERNRESKVPQHCLDKFDHRYRNPCNGGKWQERYYFDHTNGRCRAFWYDGCIAESQNIFKTRELCIGLCEAPSITAATTQSPKATTPSMKEICDPNRCLKPLMIGDCKETLPAYYYNIEKRICEPFSYSGCGGNENRFLTLSQCDQTCGNFKTLDAIETNCFLPLSIGYGRKRKSCIKNAGFAFYYNSKEKRCGRFWYLGCGGNGNRFSHASECARVCRRSHNIPVKVEPPKPVSACFLGIDNGKCENSKISNNLTRWGYVSTTGKCEKFEYSGCEGNDNRFTTHHECLKLCQNLIAPNSMQCAHYPDWGPCNRLRYMWFYNLTSGTCQQFLYGGCNGNENKFPTFELCQITCEKTGEAPSDPCSEKLDRGKWCESMSNRYYYHAKSRTCKGFHYTGCGQSKNNFLQLDECENACVHRSKSAPVAPAIISESSSSNSTGTKYASKKPSEHKPMQRHQILTESEKHYLKTEGQWVEYGHCLGFRYNISGPHTKLNSFICLMEEGGTCQIQTLTDTGGEERCRVIRPWLRGSHLYSWFFTIERRKAPWHKTPEELDEEKKSKRNAVKLKPPQKASDTVASLIILPLNDCYNIC